MAVNFDAPKVSKQMNFEDQVREVIREEGVIRRVFPPGEKLPSLRKIAASSWGTNSFTVHKALSALQNEGLLISYPRRGMFVKKRDRKLTCVGVYGDCGAANIKESPFAQVMRQTLKDELQKQGIEVDIWMDPRPQDQHGEPWQPLIKAAEQRRFQAFIGVETNLDLLQWQQKLPVPTAFLGGSASIRNNVDYDMRQFVEISLRDLARQGCRSVGLHLLLIWTEAMSSNPRGGWLTQHGFRDVGSLHEPCRRLGIDRQKRLDAVTSISLRMGAGTGALWIQAIFGIMESARKTGGFGDIHRRRGARGDHRHTGKSRYAGGAETGPP